MNPSAYIEAGVIVIIPTPNHLIPQVNSFTRIKKGDVPKPVKFSNFTSTEHSIGCNSPSTKTLAALGNSWSMMVKLMFR